MSKFVGHVALRYFFSRKFRLQLQTYELSESAISCRCIFAHASILVLGIANRNSRRELFVAHMCNADINI